MVGDSFSRGSVSSAGVGVAMGLFAAFYGLWQGTSPIDRYRAGSEVNSHPTVLGGNASAIGSSGVELGLMFDTPEDRFIGDSHSVALAMLANAKLAAGDTPGAVGTLESIPRITAREAARAVILSEIMTTITRTTALIDRFGQGEEVVDVDSQKRLQASVDQYVAIADTLETESLKCRYYARLSRLTRDLGNDGLLSKDSKPTPEESLNRADAVRARVSAAASIAMRPQSSWKSIFEFLGVPALLGTMGFLLFEASKSLCNELAKALGGVAISSLRERRNREAKTDASASTA